MSVTIGAGRTLLARCVVAFILLAGTATAEQSPTQAGWWLQWNAPEACPTQAAVQAEVHSLLEGSTRTGVSLAVSGVALAVNDGYEVELRFDSKEGPGQRVLTGRDCKEVAKAAALVIALAIDPGVTIDPNRQSALEAPTETPPPEPSPTPPGTSPAEPTKDRQRRPAPPPAPAPLPLSIEGALGAAVEWGTLPDLALGVGAGASLGIGAFRATLLGDLFPARIYDAAQDTRLQLSVWSGSLLLGYAIPFRLHALIPELGLRVGNLSAQARDADAPISADSLLLGPELGIRGTFRAGGPVGLWLGLHSGAHLRRPRLVVENRGLAHQPERVWAAAALGLSLHWP